MLLFTVLIPFASYLSVHSSSPPHSGFAVLDPAHLDSADDFSYGVSDDDSDNHFADVGKLGRSYDAVFGPDVNIEYAGLVIVLKFSVHIFPTAILHFQTYMLNHVVAFQQSIFDFPFHYLRALGSLMPACSDRRGWHALLQPQKK